jgi:hypothetical protein
MIFVFRCNIRLSHIESLKEFTHKIYARYNLLNLLNVFHADILKGHLRSVLAFTAL